MQKAVFFDFGGVIADSFEGAAKIGLKPNPDDNKTTPGTVPGMVKALKDLFDAGFQLYVVSATSTRAITDFLHVHDLSDLFTKISGYEILRSKKSRMKEIILEDELESSNCVFVTDTTDDVYEGKAANVKTIAVTWGYESAESLKKCLPDDIVNSPDELIPVINKIIS